MKTIQVHADKGACGHNHFWVNKLFKDEVGTKKFNHANFFLISSCDFITGERETLHRKTFTKWVNAKLAQVLINFRSL